MKVSFDATDRVLVVTGGASGIGAAISAAFAAAGGTSVVLDVQQGPRTPRVEFIEVDVADRESVMAAGETVVGRFGRIDGLVAGAAIQPRVRVLDMSPELWRRALSINLDGVVWACQAIVPQMVRQRSGSVLAFASGLARTGHAEASAYAASKAALVAFLQSLAAEVAEHRVRVNTVFPGVIDTPQMRAANPPGPEYDRWLRTTGVGVAEDVVGPLMFLLSDAATMTGSILTRDSVFSKEQR